MDPSGVQVIAASRLRPLLLLGLALLMGGTSAWLLTQPEQASAGRLGVTLFGLITLLAVLALIWGPRLVLDAQGLQFRSMLPVARRCAWVDIARIEVQRFGGTRFVKIVMKPGRGSILALGGSWPTPADQLAAVLERWRARYGGSQAA
jgi:hypothetical protein